MTNLSPKIVALRVHSLAATFSRSYHRATALHRPTGPPKLSPYDVNCILRGNEHTQEFFGGSVKSYDSNQLASNSPIEDSRTEGSCVHTSGLLVGIFDGHGGPACSQVISKRLMRYIAASLVPPDDLRQHMLNGAQSFSFLSCHNDKLEFVSEIKELYEKSFQQFANELTNTTLAGFQMHQTLENAFLRLDQDLSREAIEMPSLRTMSVAMSGAVALVAHIDGPHLHVASVGDCSAVLGTVTDTGQWVAKKLTNEHNTDNVGEVRRLLGEHPATERDTVIRGERLLGQLAPLRAMGDFRYKWTREQLEQMVVPQFGEQVIAPYYHTPPYLSACPEITHHILTPRDKFLIIASDGLWDTMSAMQTVHLVGEHMYGKAFLQPLTLPKQDVTLGEISQMLSTRKAGLQKKPLDRNASTHLIRNALGGTEYGVEHSKLSHMLSLPQDIVRLFRDDITITVVYFDSEYLRNCPTHRLWHLSACGLALLVLAHSTTGADLKERARAALLLEQPAGPAGCHVQQPQPCPPSKFRSASGECNNFNHRYWGARGDPFIRLLQPDYADGRLKPRTSVGSHALPAPDFVVSQLQRSVDEKTLHPHITAMLPAWGQLLAYDVVQILSPTSRYRCCRNQTQAEMTQDDVVQCYVRMGEGCREYKRSIPSHDPTNCEFHYRDQMNAASGFLDGSGLYGTTEKEIHALRTFLNGKVDTAACLRCSEPGAIGALHTVLLKEHNRIADQLAKLNAEWSDTTLFYETRRIVMAQIQHITYSEFLPILLGSQITNNADLRLENGRHYSGYSSANRAGIFAEVAVGAIPAFVTMLPPDMYNDSMSAEILLASPAMQQTFIPDHASFNDEWTPISLAVQRGRDHGIPAYHKAINLCEKRFGKPFGAKLRFDDMQYFGLGQGKREVLESMYQDPEDIDLLIGGLMETPALGTVFGPTLTCLMAIQFANMRSSDRFWYENDLPPSSLTLPQLQAIRRVTLSGLLCETKDVQRAQPKAFIREDPYLNARLNCEQLSGLDVSAWRSEQDDLVEEYMQEEQPTPPEFEELNMDLIATALNRAKTKLNERKQQEYEAWVRQGGIDAKSPDGTAASFSKANRNALIIANTSLFYELATNEIANSLHTLRRRKRQVFDNNLGGFPSDDFSNALQSVDVNQFITGSISPINLEPQCENLEAPCDTSTPFRTLTAHCNNLRSPELGQSLTTFARLLPPVYDDGISQPRSLSVTGTPLPNPRSISSLIHPDISNLHTRYSLMVMQYAQFLDHDLTMTPIHKGFHESIPSCRSCDSPRTVHPECSPFPVPPRDHYYPEVNVTSGERLCFPSMRSLPGQQTLGPREQINQNTAFLDASQIYGENGCIGKKLRGFSGRLNSTIHPIQGKELLPQSPVHPECKSPSGYCFIAGDGRASEQPGLTAIHTVFMREHNRIVEGLRGVNPHWNGDQLYEQARRIVIAQNQHITYNEFLPRILSWNAVNLYGLKLLPQGYYKEYNPTCNPSIVTEFSSAAFRIGHSLLRPHIPRLSVQHQPIDPPLLLRDGFFRTDNFLQPGLVDEISRGLVATPMETLDQFITGEVTNHLFEDRRIPFSGFDLIALNIHRGRDHGIPSYNNYRALCNLKRAQTWEDLGREIPPEVIARLRRIYAHVDDIDLFPGGMSERPLQGGLVGPTFACIIAIQFRQLRKCDRFWYENEDPVVKFTEQQLAEIRKTTLARIICENLDITGDMQRAAFDLPSNFLNPRVPCNSMPQIDLSAWRENVVQGCQIGGKNVNVGESAFPSPCTSCICTNEGPQCASLRITDCAQLAREWPREVILRDDVCSAQCGLVLQNTTPQGRNIPINLRPPPQRIARSRIVQQQTASAPFTFQGFQFPDLSQFIG